MSYFQRLGRWLLQDSGKSFMFGAAVAVGAGIACVHIVPQTFLLHKYKDIVHLYNRGFTVPITPQLRQRFNKTMDLLQMPENDRKRYEPFMVYGFDIFSAGTHYSRFGVIVGLPINFTYIDVDFIDKSKIRILDSSVPWEMDEGKLFLKSLTVSEKAQMYAMAREIEMRNTPKYYIDLIAGLANFILAYGTANQINTKYNYYAKPRVLRFTIYALLSAFSLCNYIFLKDFSQVYYEQQVDKSLIEKSPIFKEGGKEFYESILNRNIALRKLLGKAGEATYTIFGNENYFLRQRHLPLVQRKSFFDSEVEQLQ